MADTKLTALTEEAAPALADILYIVDDPAGTPTSKKVTLANIHSAADARTATLTNKTIDGNNNTISNLALGAEVSGASTALSDTSALTYNADTDASEKGWVVDEDNFASDSATKVPTQQSVKAWGESTFVVKGELDAFRVITIATDTLVLADKGKTLETTYNAGAVTVTIPTNASVAFAVRDRLDIVQIGTGQVTIQGDTGVTVNGVSAGSVTIQNQYSAASLYQRAANTWVVIGDVA